MDFGKFYKLNVLATEQEESENWTADICNICDSVITSFDVSDAPEYWEPSYPERMTNGANDIDIYIESLSIAHMETYHEAEATLISMDSDNKELVRSFIGDKVDDEV